jgi:hypothetical protein
MGTKKIFVILLAFISFLPASAFAADLFEYTMDSVSSRTNRAQCEAFVRQTAERFVAQTGITPFSHGCRQDSLDFEQLEGVISYFADERINLISSKDQRSSVDSEGAFPSQQDCLAALPRRTEQFKQIFGVEPLASWCYRLYSNSSNYVARIEALGTSEIKSQHVGFYFFGRFTLPPQTVLSTIRSAAELRFPGHVVDASFAGSLAYARATVRYYSPVRYYLDNMDEMKFATTMSCEEAALDVMGMFDNFEIKPVAAFCTSDNLAGIRVNFISFTQLIGTTDLYKHYEAPSTFPTREQCLQNADQAGSGSDNVIGAICTDTVPSVLHMILKK